MSLVIFKNYLLINTSYWYLLVKILSFSKSFSKIQARVVFICLIYFLAAARAQILHIATLYWRAILTTVFFVTFYCSCV